ncbi:MAG: hypothetical protein ABIG68_14735, partial [Acidobacteriota bacterium]
FEHRDRWRQGARAAALTAAGLLLALAPLAARNLAVGAPMLALSNRAVEVFSAGMTDARRSSVRVMETSAGNPAAVVFKTMAESIRDFGPFVRLQLWKVGLLLHPQENADNISYGYGQDLAPMLRFTLGFGMLLPLGAAGWILVRREWRPLLLIHLYAAATTSALLVTTVRGRYRLTLVPVLILFAAPFLVRLYRVVRERNRRTLAGLAALLFGALLAQHLSLAALGAGWIGPNAADYLGSAQIYAASGQYDRAAGEVSRLVDRQRRHGGDGRGLSFYEAHRRLYLGLHLLRQNLRAEARDQLVSAEAALDSGSEPSAYLLYQIGLAYLDLPDTEQAIRLLRRSLAVEPGGAVADEVRRILLQIAGTPG